MPIPCNHCDGYGSVRWVGHVGYEPDPTRQGGEECPTCCGSGLVPTLRQSIRSKCRETEKVEMAPEEYIAEFGIAGTA